MSARSRRIGVLALLAAALAAGAWWMLDRSAGNPAPTVPTRESAEPASGPVLEAGSARGKPRADAKSAPEGARLEETPGLVSVPTEEHPASLRVLVLGAKRAPLAGARVTVGERSVATDPQGVARFGGLVAPSVKVHAHAANHLPADPPPSVELHGATESELEIVLEPGHALDGRVLDARTHLPIAGARVRSRGGGDLEFQSCSGGRDSYGEAVTDGQGRFRLEALPLEWIVTLWAEERGYSRGEMCVLLHADGPAPGPVEIRLPPGGWLTATVRDPSGAAMAGATVRVVSEELGDIFVENEVPDPFDNAAWSASATTDAEGRAIVLGLPFETPLRAKAGGSGAADSEERVGLAATARDPALHVDLRLRAAATLVVLLQDLQGRAVNARGVYVDGRGPTERPEGSTEPPNEVRFEGLAPGLRQVRVRTPDFRPLEVEVDLPEGGHEERVLRLDPGSPIEGRVVDDAGAPVASADVRAYSEEPSESIVVHSGIDGAFRIAAVAGRAYDLIAAEGSVVRGQSAHLEVRAPARDVRLVCPRLTRVTVRLRAPEGHVLPSEVAVFVSLGGGGFSGTSYPYDSQRLQFPYPPSAKQLRIQADGFVPIDRDLEAAPGSETDLGELLLDPGLTVEGRVLDAAGTGIAGAEIDGAFGRGTRTDADGRFRLEHQPRADVWLSVRSEDHVGKTVEVPAAELGAPVRIMLQRGGMLVGRVLRADGTSGGKRTLTVRPEAAGDEWVQSDLEGAFRKRLLPGAYTLAIDGTDAEPRTWVTATIVEGQETSVTVRAPP